MVALFEQYYGMDVKTYKVLDNLYMLFIVSFGVSGQSSFVVPPYLFILKFTGFICFLRISDRIATFGSLCISN